MDKSNNKFVRKIYRRDSVERVEEEYEYSNLTANLWNTELERVIKRRDEYIRYLESKITKQHDENIALRGLLNDALNINSTQKDASAEATDESSELIWESAVNPRKKRKLSNHAEETNYTTTNNSKKKKTTNNSNGGDHDALKIVSVDGKYGGEFAYIKGVKQLILTGKRGGKYWIDKNGRKRRIQKYYYQKEEDDDEDDDGEYEVEKLLDHRQAEDGVEYLVRWKDFDSSNDSWEPVENFQDDQIIEKYWEQKKTCKKAKMGEFLDQILDNLNDAERVKTKKRIEMMQSSYREHMIKQVQKTTKFLLAKDVSDGLAEFISDFVDECDGNLESRLMSNGLQFLESMKRMMWYGQKRDESDDSDSDEDEDTNGNNQFDWDNPIPDYIDTITGENVIMPAISPFGHVLSYETWRKILESANRKNTCPFTKKKMNRRSLIKITHRNYLYYKDRIVNITQEHMDVMASMS